jgi:hypothetical protein
VEPIGTEIPASGDIIGTTDERSDEMALMLGDAFVDAARTRAVRRAVKSCIAKVVK